MMKRIVVLMTILCLLMVPVNVLAKGTDYSYLEDMSIKELRELDDAIHKLLGDGGSEETLEISLEDETEAEPVLMKEEDFFVDILQSYSDRNNATYKYTNAELNSMSGKEQVKCYAEFVEAERGFYDKYKNAIFEDLNIQYLCNQYIAGLENQFEAPNKIGANGDLTFYNNEWSAGYNKRSYVIVELADYYDVAFPADAVAEMRKNVYLSGWIRLSV